MRTRTLLLACIFSVFSQYSFAQGGNLVPNGGFDEMKGKIKKPGSIEMTANWKSPTDPPADLYSEKSKGDFAAPDNKRGRENPDEGQCYAGIRVYSYKGREDIQFLSNELEYPLQEEELYCIKFLCSLSDLSKYSANNLGLYISSQKPTGKQIQSFVLEPQITHSKNKIMEEQYTWEPVCQIYKAEGGEKFIVIGNFARPEDTKWKKMKRPKGFNTPQTTDAYYYIEGVSVLPMDSVEDCSCERGGTKMNIVYSKNVSAEATAHDESFIELTRIYFKYKTTKVIANSVSSMDSLVQVLVREPDFKLEVQGHTEIQEQLRIDAEDGDNIGEQRAKTVFDYLVSKGISESRLIYKGFRDNKPIDEGTSEDARARNRRVDFKLIKN